MPPVAAAVAAHAVVSGLALTGLTAAIVGGVVSFAVNAAFSAMSSKKSGGATDAASLANRSQTVTRLEPAQAHQIVYGEVRKGGTIVFQHATDADNAQLVTENHVVPSSAPYTVTVSDYVSDSQVITREYVQIEDADGTFSTYQDVLLSSGYSVSAGVYTFDAAHAGKSVQIQYNKRLASSAHVYLHLVIVLAAHECEAIETVYFNNEAVTLDGGGYATGKYAGNVFIAKHLGAVNQAADATLIAAAPNKWTGDHRLAGHCYIYVRLHKNFDLFPGGVPNITAMVRGRKVYDSRNGITAFTANAALCIADYLNNSVFGLGAAYGTEIDTATLNAAANICDELVPRAGANVGPEVRYRCDGIVDTSQEPQSILEKMLTSLAGRLVYVGGRWRLRAGAFITPTVTLGEGDARGPIKVNTKLSRRDVFNGVKGVYVSPENNWQPADFPPVTNATYLAEDGGERVWFDMELPYTISGSAAQRLAKIELERVRQQITVVYPAKLNGYLIEPPETLMLNNTRFGYASKVFEEVEMKLVVAQDDEGNPILGVDLALRETAAGVYDWNSGEETTVDLAPNTSLPDARVVAPPGIPSIAEELYETTNSTGVKSRVIVTWAAAPDAHAWRYEHEYKLRSSAVWTSTVGIITGTHAEITDIAPGVYQSRVRSVTRLGVPSAWAQKEFEVIGLTAAPADVSGFSVQSYAGRARLVWDRSPDIDVRNGGRVMIRWSPLLSGVDWNHATLINADGFAGDATIGEGMLQTGTYLAKFRDSTLNHSVNAASFVITEALLRDLLSLGFVDLHPTFAGALDNTLVTDDALQLTSTSLWDDLPGDVDDLDVIDAIGGTPPSGSAVFDDILDLGAVTTCRLFTTIQSEGVNLGDTWDTRTTLIDSWAGLIDGDVIEDAEVVIGVRITDEDPTGTPTWGPWHSLGLVADYTARAFQFRADFTSGDPTHNRRITELTITAKEEV